MIDDNEPVIYLSGPMTGLPDFNYPLFHGVAEHFRSEGLTILSPAEVDGGEQVVAHESHCAGNSTPEACTCIAGAKAAKPWQYYMTKAITMQMQANAWAGLPGWFNSRGAKREFDLAVDLRHALYLVKFMPFGPVLEELP
jgi:hypothetical protein